VPGHDLDRVDAGPLPIPATPATAVRLHYFHDAQRQLAETEELYGGVSE
jgi:hypothetical protein